MIPQPPAAWMDAELQQLADTRLARKISQLSGVGLVTLSGGHKPAIRVQANLRAMAAYGLNIDDLRTTLDKMQARVEYDLEYLRNWSLGLDLVIILRTVKSVLADSKAY